MPGDFEREEKSAFPVAFAIGIVVVLVLVAGLILVTRMTRSKAPAAQPLPFGAAEQAAAARIHFIEPQMAQASNYLNQQVTYVAGTISNDGVATIREIEVNFEFHDPFKQVILRETRRLARPQCATNHRRRPPRFPNHPRLRPSRMGSAIPHNPNHGLQLQ